MFLSFISQLLSPMFAWLTEAHRRLEMGQNKAAIAAFEQVLKEPKARSFSPAFGDQAFAKLQLVEHDPRFCTVLSLIKHETWMDDLLDSALKDIDSALEITSVRL